ncbi:MAG: LysR family transcriptional regulator [Halomonadaceae bacterium]|nr:MAG: LysR family transcriptional regulator [Halomonadaceae bacterium]
MQTQSLAAFVAIVDSGSFSAAADQLGVSQSAISKRLANLEQQYNRPLIERDGRHARLTEAGERLLPHARQVLDELHNARLSLEQPARSFSGPVRLITSHHIGLHHLPVWLKTFRLQHPGVQFQLQFMESEQAFAALQRREASLALITLNDRLQQHFELHHTWQDPMYFVCGRDHPLAALPQPTLGDLAQHEAILPAATTETYRVVSHLFLVNGLRLQAQMPTNYLETIKMMTSVGLGWSVLPGTMLDDELVQLPVPANVSRVLGAVGLWRRDPGPVARALLELIQQEQAQAG